MVYAKTELFDEALQEAANLFKALSHPARLQILHFLAETSTCISGDISEELPLSRTTVNQHLKELKNIGLIQGTVEGVKMNYCLNPGRIDQLKSLLDQVIGQIQTDNAGCGNTKTEIQKCVTTK